MSDEREKPTAKKRKTNDGPAKVAPYVRPQGTFVNETGGMRIISNRIPQVNYFSSVKRVLKKSSSDVTSSEVDSATNTNAGTSRKEKVSNTMHPHELLQEFSKNWAQRLLEVMYRNEYDENFGKPCRYCAEPSTNLSIYRCFDCMQSPPMCEICIITSHKHNPFHWIEKWNGAYLVKCSLFDLGFIHYIGHYGEKCKNARPPVKTTIVHLNGVHNCLASYCGCDTSYDTHNPSDTQAYRPTQLLSTGLYPGSFKRTQTAFTTHVLKHFHHLTLQAKLTAHDFYITLRRLTSNAFFHECQDRYHEFMAAHRQYAFLRMLRWNNQRADQPLSPGSLAVRCPACPQPGINMDPDWKSCRVEDAFIHAFSYSKDGNFQQNQHDKKMDKLDVPLMKGAAYYADEDEYSSYLKKMAGTDLDKETSTCSNFKAMTNQYSGKIVSGIISLTCSRQGYILPTGTVDLTQGKRYTNVDFATVKGLELWQDVPFIVSSYDINCQYDIRATSHEEMCSEISSYWAQTELPVASFFLVYAEVGQTDGEAPERRWASDNAIARSTREMGPGHRHDILNYHSSDFNIRKTFQMITSLLKKYGTAILSYGQHKKALVEFEDTVLCNNLPLSQWKKNEEAWKKKITSKEASDDPRCLNSLENPYEPRQEKVPTEKQVIAILDKELQVQRDGNDESAMMGLGKFLKRGIEIQKKQHVIRQQLVNDPECVTVEDDRAALEVQIRRWSDYFPLFFGDVMDQIATDLDLTDIDYPVLPDLSSDYVEEVTLPLPSLFPNVILKHVDFKLLVDAEIKIREGQAHDVLSQLRTKLTYKAFLGKQFKQSVGQGALTRAKEVIKGTDNAVLELREEYTTAYNALLALTCGNIDKTKFDVLKEADCAPPVLFHANETLGGRVQSWIWGRQPGKANSDSSEISSDMTNEMMRVEWFRCSAKATRWREEMMILEEEIRRTQRFFLYMTQKWKDVGLECDLKANTLEQGRAVFAERQAAIYRRLLMDAQAKSPEKLRIILPASMQQELEQSAMDFGSSIDSLD